MRISIDRGGKGVHSLLRRAMQDLVCPPRKALVYPPRAGVAAVDHVSFTRRRRPRRQSSYCALEFKPHDVTCSTRCTALQPDERHNYPSRLCQRANRAHWRRATPTMTESGTQMLILCAESTLLLQQRPVVGSLRVRVHIMPPTLRNEAARGHALEGAFC